MKIKFNFLLVIVVLIISLILLDYVYISAIITNWHTVNNLKCLIVPIISINIVFVGLIQMILDY